MDRISDSGSDDVGSNPVGITKKEALKPLFLYTYSIIMSEKYTVYVLQSLVDNRIYVGFTPDMERRLKGHDSGKTLSTKGYIPWELFFTEEFAGTTADARKKEK
jgi:putative endonuclease